MKSSWRDALAGVLALVAAVLVFAKLQGYTWWLIGSWKGALGVLALFGLGIIASNLVEYVEVVDIPSFLETFLWLTAATIVIGCLFSTTTRNEFISSAIAIGVAWIVPFSRHLWSNAHNHHDYLHLSPG